MRTIRKNREPACLVAHRCKPGAVYDERGMVPGDGPNPSELPGDAKEELRDALVNEQRGLCCYCCCAIAPTWDGVRIEHWEPISLFPERQLDYSNLMAACKGDIGTHRHCDVRKGNETLSRNPSNPVHRVEDIVHYRTDGTIRSTDLTFDGELGETEGSAAANPERVLNLNLAFLCNHRKAVMDSFTHGLQKRGQLDRPALQRLLAKWSGDQGGRLEPFSPVVVWWLRKRLNRA